MKRQIATVIALLGFVAPSQADEVAAKDAVLLWRAWLCQVYAVTLKDDRESARLFDVGYQAGQRFMAAAQAGKITAEDMDSVVPMAVAWTRSGPTPEFVLGRIYESAATQASDDMAKEGLDGMPLEIKDWVTDPELLRGRAEINYDRSNCELL